MHSNRFFQAAIAVVGVAVADDRFIQPQPGTSAVDHLASGLIPLALLGLAAWSFPRVRPARRAWDALTGPKEIWDIPEASHTGGSAARPTEYERRVVAFFDRAL